MTSEPRVEPAVWEAPARAGGAGESGAGESGAGRSDGGVGGADASACVAAIDAVRFGARGDGVALCDQVAVEEPLEIRLEGLPVAVVMRTPGDDEALVAGFLLTEGVVERAGQIAAIGLVGGTRERRRAGGEAAGAVAARAAVLAPPAGADSAAAGEGRAGRVAEVRLAPGLSVDLESLRRNLYAASSCGICGKASLAGVLRRVAALPPGPVIARAVLAGLSERMRERQRGFAATGGLHAAAVLDRDGHVLALAEDVGRHNAADKALGALLLGRAPRERAALLWVSGRASFEIVQKAACARVPAVCAVSAPSSLAIDLARAAGMTLIGFLRGDGFNVYAGAERVAPGGAA